MSFSAITDLTDEEKDREIKSARKHLSSIKKFVLNVLTNNHIVII